MSKGKVVKNNALLVRALEIDENGQLKKKVMELDRDSQLENTLLQALYPGVQVATVDVPRQQLDKADLLPARCSQHVSHNSGK